MQLIKSDPTSKRNLNIFDAVLTYHISKSFLVEAETYVKYRSITSHSENIFLQDL